MQKHTVVREDAYGVVADVVPESGFRSDAIAEGYRISERLKARGRDPELLEADDGVVVRLFVGDDAADEEIEDAAHDMLEAVGWR